MVPSCWWEWQLEDDNRACDVSISNQPTKVSIETVFDGPVRTKFCRTRKRSNDFPWNKYMIRTLSVRLTAIHAVDTVSPFNTVIVNCHSNLVRAEISKYTQAVCKLFRWQEVHRNRMPVDFTLKMVWTARIPVVHQYFQRNLKNRSTAYHYSLKNRFIIEIFWSLDYILDAFEAQTVASIVIWLVRETSRSQLRFKV